MKIIGLLLLSVSIVSCQKKELAENFRAEILAYQRKVPLPIKAGKYLYVVHFSRQGNDTLFNLIRGHGVSKNDSVFGIYEDETLKPLVIIDHYKLGQNTIYSKKKNTDIKKYIKTHSKEDYPPLYRYQLKNKKIILIKIDTISDQWDK